MHHRHGAEIEQGAGTEVTFTPHLLPIDRGILETIYVRVAPGTTEAAIGDIYERLRRFDEAAIAYNNYINLLPNKDRSDKAAWSRTQVRFLEAFEGKTPAEIALSILTEVVATKNGVAAAAVLSSAPSQPSTDAVTHP